MKVAVFAGQRHRPVRTVLAAGLAALLFPAAVRAQAAGRQLLHGNVPPAMARLHLKPTGRLPATNRLHLAIGLPLRNQAALHKLLAEIYDPASTNYHHYLTPQQFAARFGPTEQNYQAVIEFAKANGLTVTATHPNRTVVDVSGSVAAIEKAFHVTLHTYRRPAEHRTFFAPDTEPSVDLNVPLLHVSGLDNYFIPRPAIIKKYPLNSRPAGVAPASGSSPGGEYWGTDFRAAYAPGVTLDGDGQTVGLFELDGYYTNDITTYENQAGLPNTTLTNIYIDGFNGTPGSGNIEVALDIDMAIAMATNLAQVVVYEALNNGNSAYIIDMLNRIASDNLAKQISSSWLIGDNPNYEAVYEQMALQGQSFFQASGDDGAYSSNIPQWADDTNITLVGGTTLYTTGPNGSWSSETAWNWYITDPPNTNSTGGGVSFNGVPIPSYQTGINMTTNQGSTTLRNVPDVALTADNILVIADNGTSYSVGGTSAAAPLWAGFTALMNQQAREAGRSTVGFLNPAIYAVGKGTNYHLDFHDIITGNNTNVAVTTKYFAVPGYDLCTGWGTPNGSNLINALAGPPDTLVVTPFEGLAAIGPKGGPFHPAGASFTLTNSGTNSLDWSFGSPPSWLDVSSSSGTLTAGGQTTVTVSLNPASTNLTDGTYAADLWFTNNTSGGRQLRQFTLQVVPTLIITPATGFAANGLMGGPFNVTTQTFALSNLLATPLNWQIGNTSTWLNVSPASGTLDSNGQTTVTASLNSTATNLAVGSYTSTVFFTNQTSSTVQTRQFSLSIRQELVQNGGFETGDFTGWTLDGDPNPYNYVANNSSGTFISPHSGTYFTAFGEYGSLAYLSQSIPTIAGQAYVLSLWLNSPTVPGGNTPNEFAVAWNGNTLFDQSDIPPVTNPSSGWTNLQFVVTATGSSTSLQFGARDDPAYLGLDDVSVSPIPAAAFQPTAVDVTNNNLTFTWNALTDLVYQVQFKTNLLQTNWVVLKSISPTNSPVIFTDTNSVTGSPQKFYRLQVLP